MGGVFPASEALAVGVGEAPFLRELTMGVVKSEKLYF